MDGHIKINENTPNQSAYNKHFDSNLASDYLEENLDKKINTFFRLKRSK